MRFLVLFGLAALVGCTSSTNDSLAPLDVAPGCNPLGSNGDTVSDCLLPYPSDFYRVADETGARIAIDDVALPATKKGETFHPFALHAVSGFSPGSQILAVFPEGIDGSTLVDATQPVEDSVAESSPTILLDSQGQRILHLAELDPRAKDDSRRALLIRPLERLRDGARYIVAIRGLRGTNGSLLPAREGFRRLRDGETGGDPAFARFAAFESDVLEPLAAAGIARDDLQLAWDFTVRPREDAIGDMLSIRQTMLDAPTPTVTVTSVDDQPNEHTARRIHVTIEVPLFLESTAPMARLVRDAEGHVAPNGTAKVPATVWIPMRALDPLPSEPARVVQFGHGFFGARTEVDGFMAGFANERNYVVAATDWWGMSDPDLGPVGDAISVDLDHALAFTDRVHQAMANQLALTAALPAIAALPEAQVGSAPPFDAAHPYFYGISMGHILGSTFLALSPSIARGALSVGGADWSLMMFRAQPFLPFLALLQFTLPDALDQQKFVMFAQGEMDRIDPLLYAPHMLAEPLPGSPVARRVLMHFGIGDASVPNLASELHARALGLTQLGPTTHPIARLAQTDQPVDGSAVVTFDFGVSPLPGRTATPATGSNPVHGGVRAAAASREQIDRFFRPDGWIEPTCDGPCDPE